MENVIKKDEILISDSRVNNNRANPFIESNTQDVKLSHLEDDCIIPVFSKDNETTISHYQFVTSVLEMTNSVFEGFEISDPEIRVSHVIKGRVPSAIGKPAIELLDEEKTIYYERMAFNIQIPTISKQVNGNKLMLSLGGVRAYNQENLYSKKGMEKFKLYIGFKNMVCTNLCISTDGFKNDIRVSSLEALCESTLALFNRYNQSEHLNVLESFHTHALSESQFAHLIGKLRMANYQQSEIDNPIRLNDTQINNVVKNYYGDKNFKCSNNGSISLWNLYNLFTGANRSSYIDSFLERGLNAYEFTKELVYSIENRSPNWYLDN